MILSKLDLLCLNAMSDDYENITEIFKDVSTDFSGEVKKEGVVASLRKLIVDNDVNICVYNVQKQEFEVKQMSCFIDFDHRLTYFDLTERGRNELDEQWEGIMGNSELRT